MRSTARATRQLRGQLTQVAHMHHADRQPAQPAPGGSRLVQRMRRARQDGPGCRHQQQAGQAQLGPAQAPGQPAGQRRTGRRQGEQRAALCCTTKQPVNLADPGEHPPGQAPGQQQPGQLQQADAPLGGLSVLVFPPQAPGPQQRRQTQQRRRPEAGVGQRCRFSLTGHLPERRGKEETATRHALQQQGKYKGRALLQTQGQPENHQTVASPNRTGRTPGQDEQHREVDQQQAGQQHQRQTAQQPTVLSHQGITRGQQHAANQRQADQQAEQQAAPARSQHALAAAGPIQLADEQHATQQLHGKRCAEEDSGAQAQAQQQGQQAAQCPGHGGEIGG